MKKAICTFALLMSLAACGVKPGNVDPPEEAKGQIYPAQYPSDVTK